jgi:hypothetical protein
VKHFTEKFSFYRVFLFVVVLFFLIGSIPVSGFLSFNMTATSHENRPVPIAVPRHQRLS